MSTPADKKLLKQVAELGFICQAEDEQLCQIYPPQSPPQWHLQQQEEHWVLYVGTIPQILFHSIEMIKFLQHQKKQWMKSLPKP